VPVFDSFFLFIFITALLVFVSIAFFFGLNQMFFSFRFDYPMKNVTLLITSMLGLCAGKDKISLKISKCSVMNFINILQAPCAKKFHIKKLLLNVGEIETCGQYHQHFIKALLYKSALRSFSLVSFCCNFLAQKYW
jgi:hypothetical protein